MSGTNTPILALCAVTLAFCGAAGSARAATRASEHEIKAAYIYNFTQFVSWEQQPDTWAHGSFNICVLGDDPVAAQLKSLPETEVSSRPVRVARLESAAEAPSCQILFISRSRQAEAPEILRTLKKGGTLSVSDIPGFAAAGGIIGFATQNKRVKIELNMKAAKEAGLKPSPSLLSVAQIAGAR